MGPVNSTAPPGGDIAHIPCSPATATMSGSDRRSGAAKAMAMASAVVLAQTSTAIPVMKGAKTTAVMARI